MLLDALFRTHDKIENLQTNIRGLQRRLTQLTVKKGQFKVKGRLLQTVLLSAFEEKLSGLLVAERRCVEEEGRVIKRLSEAIKREGGYTTDVDYDSEDVDVSF